MPFPTFKEPEYSPLGYIQASVTSSALTLQAMGVPANILSQSKVCVIVVEDQAVRWRDDSTAPTAAIGMQIAAGGTLTFTGQAILQNLQLIAQTGTAEVNMSFYH